MVNHIQALTQSLLLGGNMWMIIGFAFIAGILTSFTPCLYPMIPITMGILQSQKTTSVWSSFLLSLSYVLGMASIYATLGYIAATSSIMFGRWASSPYIIAILVMLFLYLAGSMFGFYELKVPSFTQKNQDISIKFPYLRSFVLGLFAGLIASPCLTPPLAMLLAFVAQVGNPFIGFAALFAFSLGMGLLLLVVGTFSNSLTLLPRAGTWMTEVKKIFGFIMVAMAVFVATPLLHEALPVLLYSAIGVATVGYYTWVIYKAITSRQP